MNLEKILPPYLSDNRNWLKFPGAFSKHSLQKSFKLLQSFPHFCEIPLPRWVEESIIKGPGARDYSPLDSIDHFSGALLWKIYVIRSIN
jgi:hypothetical protein